MADMDSLRSIVADILRTVPPPAPKTDSFWDDSIWTRYQREYGASLLLYIDRDEAADSRERESDKIGDLQTRIDELEGMLDDQQKHNVKLAEKLAAIVKLAS